MAGLLDDLLLQPDDSEDDMKLCTDPMMHHNHSDVFGQRLCDGLPQNKTRGLIFGLLGGSSKGGLFLDWEFMLFAAKS